MATAPKKPKPWVIVSRHTFTPKGASAPVTSAHFFAYSLGIGNSFRTKVADAQHYATKAEANAARRAHGMTMRCYSVERASDHEGKGK